MGNKSASPPDCDRPPTSAHHCGRPRGAGRTSPMNDESKRNRAGTQTNNAPPSELSGAQKHSGCLPKKNKRDDHRTAHPRAKARQRRGGEYPMKAKKAGAPSAHRLRPPRPLCDYDILTATAHALRPHDRRERKGIEREVPRLF